MLAIILRLSLSKFNVYLLINFMKRMQDSHNKEKIKTDVSNILQQELKYYEILKNTESSFIKCYISIQEEQNVHRLLEILQRVEGIDV